MTKYIAAVNTPGCLPDSEPVEFDSVTEAWEYLADERNFELGACETPHGCTSCFDWHFHNSGEAIRGREVIDSVWFPTAGRCQSDPWDLGLVYSVDAAEDED